jgi:hypothetical protein
LIDSHYKKEKGLAYPLFVQLFIVVLYTVFVTDFTSKDIAKYIRGVIAVRKTIEIIGDGQDYPAAIISDSGLNRAA